MMETKQNERTVIVQLTPHDVSTDGYLHIHEWDHDVTFRFLPDPGFRGKLKAVVWNVQDNVQHRLTADEEDFPFIQVGERPEIRVSSSFFTELSLPSLSMLRIKFEFDTFRAEPDWYGYLYFKRTYGDMQEDTDAAYKIPRPKSSSASDCDCDCDCTCCECSTT